MLGKVVTHTSTNITPLVPSPVATISYSCIICRGHLLMIGSRRLPRSPVSARGARSTGPNPSTEWVDSLKPSDVLFGRGSGANEHEGNIQFRNLVRQYKHEYITSSDRETKNRIASHIVTTVHSQGGRFLRKADSKDRRSLGIPKDVTEAWCFVDKKAIMEKAKQALRQKATWKEEANDSSTTTAQGHHSDETQAHSWVQSTGNPYSQTASANVAIAGDEEPFDWRQEARGGTNNNETIPAATDMLFGRDLLENKEGRNT